MPIEISMPRVLDSMTHGAVAAWRKREGELVRAGEVLAEIEADKTTVDLESPGDGTLAKILVPAGTEKVEVGALLAVLDEPGRAGTRSESSSPPVVAREAEAPVPVLDVAAVKAGAAASPLALSMAHQAGLDLASLHGTGREGKVVQADVIRALGGSRGVPERPAPAAAANGAAGLSSVDSPDELLPHSRIRRVIAGRLSESKRTIPHFYLEVQCCVDPLLRVRDELPTARRGGPRLSINDFAVRAAALAIRAVPEVNASWSDQAIRRYQRVDLAVAVATDAGLVAPVVREADRKGLAELAAELRDLAQRARAGRLRPEELEGGTFTVSNLGMHGVDALYAIINPPQAGILGLGAAAPRPVARDGAVAVATMMTCTLSADHRVFDGATGARLLAAFKGFLEQPLTMLL
jgi:pyruvate dehydrogenase E2 component (dihydrolipoamide acetyltransferase)